VSHKHITTAEELDALSVGTVVALLQGSETVNVALKTGADEFGLAGKSPRFTTATLFRIAVGRDGFTLAVLHAPKES